MIVCSQRTSSVSGILYIGNISNQHARTLYCDSGKSDNAKGNKNSRKLTYIFIVRHGCELGSSTQVMQGEREDEIEARPVDEEGNEQKMERGEKKRYLFVLFL